MLLKGILLIQVIFITFEVIGGASVNDPKAIQKLVVGNTKFGLQLYEQIAKDKPGENVFFSPASISFALALTLLGARGDTSKELKETLQLAGFSDSELPLLYKAVTNVLLQTDDKFQLDIANRIFGEQSFKISPEYLQRSKQIFGSELAKVDFVNNAEGARKTINNWVSQQTNDKIKDLIPVGTLNELTRLVLVNAIYFKGEWQTKFDKELTKEENFVVSKDQAVKTELLYLPKVKLNYINDAYLQAQVVELPYSGEYLSFYVILPDSQLTTVEEVESKLSAEHLASLQLYEEEVYVWLPKFKLELDVTLNEYLKKLGLEKLFSPTEADLTGISEEGGLYVSKVLHKAFIEVNEEGSEAAAATGISIGNGAVPALKERVNIKADHPFLFYIKDNRTGTILFFGKFMKP